MKKAAALFLVSLLLNVSLAAAAGEIGIDAVKTSCAESRAKGKHDADAHHSSLGWWGRGVAAGFFGAFLPGTVLVWGASFFSNPQPSTIPADVDEHCYRQGYKKEAKQENNGGALVGGIIGGLSIIPVVMGIMILTR